MLGVGTQISKINSFIILTSKIHQTTNDDDDENYIIFTVYLRIIPSHVVDAA